MKKFLFVSTLMVIAICIFVSCVGFSNKEVGNATIFLEDNAVFPPAENLTLTYGFVKTDDGKCYQLIFSISKKTNDYAFICTGDEEAAFSTEHEHCFVILDENKTWHDVFNDQTREYYYENNGEIIGEVSKYNKTCRVTIIEPLSKITGEIEIYDNNDIYRMSNTLK